MATETTVAPPRRKETLDSAVIRFAGDSGDGMQITGSQFTNTTALFGNDLATFPDFPAEIRAPAGTLPGVIGLPDPLRREGHLHARRRGRRADRDEPGRAQDRTSPTCKTGGILIVNVDNFKEIDLKKAQVAVNPLEDGSLEGYRLFPVELTKLTRAALKDLGLDAKSMDRCKNFFALGMCYWLYNRSMDATHRWLDEKFGAKPELAEANKLAMKAGYALLRGDRGVPGHLRGPAREARARHLPQHHRATPRWRWASWRRRRRRGCGSSRAATRSRPPPTSCTSCRCTRTSA